VFRRSETAQFLVGGTRNFIDVREQGRLLLNVE
jgi:hypothetical protein